MNEKSQFSLIFFMVKFSQGGRHMKKIVCYALISLVILQPFVSFSLKNNLKTNDLPVCVYDKEGSVINNPCQEYKVSTRSHDYGPD